MAEIPNKEIKKSEVACMWLSRNCGRNIGVIALLSYSSRLIEGKRRNRAAMAIAIACLSARRRKRRVVCLIVQTNGFPKGKRKRRPWERKRMKALLTSDTITAK